MRTIYNIYFIILKILFFCIILSCETDVTDDITIRSSEPRLVVEGGLERNVRFPDRPQLVRLTTTRNFLSNEPNPPVTDAVILISDGDQDWELVHTGEGYYEAAGLQPELDTTYTITISWNGSVYQGSDTLSAVPLFDRFYFEFEEETLVTDEGYFLRIDTQDFQGIANFYYYRVFKNGEYIIVPDPGNSIVLVVSDEFFDGQLRVGVNPNDEVSFEPGDLAGAQQLGISEAYYDFLFQVFEQTGNSGVSFVGNPPPASIRGNIINLTDSKNRALGFFYTADVEEQTIMITE
ncbi:DUF4249 domain-containing protein [Ascidiimonas aurantiaca]|uniref:DUF4249 domain-containing protein n=1 Tax=Ascidiimonas aurantiaca TaxID=1685432 RepID=UPI0030EF510E